MRLQNRPRVRITEKQVFIAATVSFAALTVFLVFFGYFQSVNIEKAKASTGETLASGSFIINMGITPQTVANGLKPYGLVHELVMVRNVPVKWVIETTKGQNGADFVHNGVTYRGGTFIIPAQFIDSTIASRIAYWQTLGVVGNYSVSDITVPVYMTITSYPRVVVDTLANNDTIIGDYFLNAGISPTAYEKGAPSTVTTCHDIWVNPHGDPVWETHYYLKNFVTVQKSYIWSQCHAVSMLEACRNPANSTEQLNYLTTNGLQCWRSAKCGWVTEAHASTIPTPVTYSGWGDPVMQFMNSIHNASGAGSERWFIPMTTGGWRPTTKRYVAVGTTASPREGVVLAYGYAYGDSTYGQVMYQGGHDLTGNGSIDHQVGAQRAFFNFMFLAAKAKTPLMASSINSNMNVGTTYNLSVNVSGGQPPYTYHWMSSNGGTFSDTTISNPTFTPPFSEAPNSSVITCVITDACGRRNFHTQMVSFTPGPLPITLVSFDAEQAGTSVLVKWVTGSEYNNKYFTVQRSANGTHYNDLRIVPSQGNSIVRQNYSVADGKPLKGVSYYRLVQTDVSGVTTTFPAVKVETSASYSAQEVLRVGPNPFIDKMELSVLSEDSGSVTIELFSASGARARKYTKDIVKGDNTFMLEGLSDIPPGSYILRITKGDELLASRKLVKR